MEKSAFSGGAEPAVYAPDLYNWRFALAMASCAAFWLILGQTALQALLA